MDKEQTKCDKLKLEIDKLKIEIKKLDQSIISLKETSYGGIKLKEAPKVQPVNKDENDYYKIDFFMDLEN